MRTHYEIELEPPVSRSVLSTAITRATAVLPYFSSRGVTEEGHLLWVLQQKVEWTVTPHAGRYNMARALVDLGTRDPVDLFYIRPASPEYSEPPVDMSAELEHSEATRYLEAVRNELNHHWHAEGVDGLVKSTPRVQR